MSIESPLPVNIVDNSIEPILIKSGTDESFELAAATTNPTHPFLGPKLADTLGMYSTGAVKVEDPALVNILDNLIQPDAESGDNYPEMLATYFQVIKEKNARAEAGLVDDVIDQQSDKIINDLQKRLQSRMATLTNRDPITSGTVLSPN